MYYSVDRFLQKKLTFGPASLMISATFVASAIPRQTGKVNCDMKRYSYSCVYSTDSPWMQSSWDSWLELEESKWAASLQWQPKRCYLRHLGCYEFLQEKILKGGRARWGKETPFRSSCIHSGYCQLRNRGYHGGIQVRKTWCTRPPDYCCTRHRIGLIRLGCVRWFASEGRHHPSAFLQLSHLASYWCDSSLSLKRSPDITAAEKLPFPQTSVSTKYLIDWRHPSLWMEHENMSSWTVWSGKSDGDGSK